MISHIGPYPFLIVMFPVVLNFLIIDLTIDMGLI